MKIVCLEWGCKYCVTKEHKGKVKGFCSRKKITIRRLECQDHEPLIMGRKLK